MKNFWLKRSRAQIRRLSTKQRHGLDKIRRANRDQNRQWFNSFQMLENRILLASDFQIVVEYPAPSPTSSGETYTLAQKAIIQDAADRWEEVITGTPDPAPGIFTLTLQADIAEKTGGGSFFDGPGGTAARGGPLTLSAAPELLPITGFFTFDQADIDTTTSGLGFYQIIVHEMGHVLGIGTLWGSGVTGGRNLINNPGSANPTFTGAAAIAAYAAAGGAGEVPVEVGVEAHWRESALVSEIMTPSSDVGFNPLSAITVGSLQDLGYTVDSTKADGFGDGFAAVSISQNKGTARNDSVQAEDLGNDGTFLYPVLFIVTRNGDTSGKTTVTYQISGAGVNPPDINDFVSLTSFPFTGTVEIPDGANSASIQILVKDDLIAESDEKFNVSIDSVSNDAGVTTQVAGHGGNSALGIILNDDYDFNGTTGPDVMSFSVINDGFQVTINASQYTFINRVIPQFNFHGLDGNDQINISGGAIPGFIPVQVPVINIFGGINSDVININSLRLGTVLTAEGGDGNDTLSVSSSVKIRTTLLGGIGSDTIRGGGGKDLLVGGPGNDMYMFDTDIALGSDVIDESGGGNDSLDFSETTTRNVVINLSKAGAQIVNAGLTLALSAINTLDNAIGGALDNTLTGNSLINKLTGGAGNDKLTGKELNDLLTGQAGNDTYYFDTDFALGSDTIDESGGGTDTINFSSTSTRPVNVNLSSGIAQAVNAGLILNLSAGNTMENVVGGILGDTLGGNALANTFTGGNGNDVMVGAAGNDTYLFDTDSALGSDTINEAGGGIDTLNFGATTTRPVTVDLSTAAAQAVNVVLNLTLSAGNTIENVIGGAKNDMLTGNNLANVISGLDGNDTLVGNGGRNILIGGTGLDTLTGGTGEDLMLGASYTGGASPTLLIKLLNEWTSASSYQDRMDHLLGNLAGGLNGTTVLSSTTVDEDAKNDTMSGNTGKDWYFRNSLGALVANRDTVNDPDIAGIDLSEFTEISTW